jgi:spoIIIJ-associated protein
MEWVETTGRSIEEAKDAALDQLGVDEQDAEFDVIEEPKFGLFGRLRSEARVRARVRPTKPRAKEDRRDRRRRRGGDTTDAAAAPPAAARSSAGGDPEQPRAGSESGREKAGRPVSVQAVSGGRSESGSRRRKRERSAGPTSRPAGREEAPTVDRGDTDAEGRQDGGAVIDVPLEQQGQVARQFLDELVGRMSLEAEISMSIPDDETVEFNLQGSSLGLLIGPRGTTLLALQDLTRTVVQRKTNAGNGRIMVDVSGYRQKRKQALERFAHQLAEEVRQSSSRKVLEPMSAADRKIVHDAINEIDGVTTTSEGEEPRRRVVILPSTT